MVKFSLREFERRLFDLRETTFVGLSTVTVPDMRKTGNPFADRVVKIARLRGVVNWRYARAVNRRREKEDKPADFQAAEPIWGHKIEFCPLVAHVGPDGVLLYLNVKVEQRQWWYFDRNTLEEIPSAELDRFLSKRERESRQGLDHEVTVRRYGLGSIAEMRVQREEWHIVPQWYEFALFTRVPELTGCGISSQKPGTCSPVGEPIGSAG